MAGLGNKSGNSEISRGVFDHVDFCEAAGTLLEAAEVAH